MAWPYFQIFDKAGKASKGQTNTLAYCHPKGSSAKPYICVGPCGAKFMYGTALLANIRQSWHGKDKQTL